jgi:hypothetical protein
MPKSRSFRYKVALAIVDARICLPSEIVSSPEDSVDRILVMTRIDRLGYDIRSESSERGKHADVIGCLARRAERSARLLLIKAATGTVLERCGILSP